ncbi:MAG: GNAT family N-acetyltransferase [bacterium]|nr:GNAT family N-acetyltransferase [bacterium]
MFSFCKPVSSKRRFLPFRKLNEEFSFTLYERADAINTHDWEAITHHKTIFLEKEYLQIVEGSEYTKLMYRYVIVYCDKKPCGIIYFQIADFKAGVFGELLNKEVETIKERRRNLFERYIDSNKHEVMLRLFTCGNNLVSGEYGFLFDKKLSAKRAHEVLLELINVVSKEEKLRGTISAILLKDYYKPLQPKAPFLENNYYEFSVEPNMIVNIPPQVNSLEEYIGLFSKKYRNRAKGILKGLHGIDVRYLDLEEVVSYEKDMYRLYENIFEKAKFKLIKLPRNYFSEVKKLFHKNFTVKAFFLNDTLVAFGTCFLKGDGCMEAHYVGFDYELNAQHNLYQNLLYSLIKEAIVHKRTRVNLGRTAAEIKTTVGAKPEDLTCYIKPQNTISKIIQKPFIAFLQPAAWIPRNPFKEEEAENLKEELRSQ